MRFLKWRFSLPVIKSGMHSLEVFSLTMILDVLENPILIPGTHPVKTTE